MQQLMTNVCTVHEVSDNGLYLWYMNGCYQGLITVIKVTPRYVTCLGGSAFDKTEYTVPDTRFIGPLPNKIFTPT